MQTLQPSVQVLLLDGQQHLLCRLRHNSLNFSCPSSCSRCCICTSSCFICWFGCGRRGGYTFENVRYHCGLTRKPKDLNCTSAARAALQHLTAWYQCSHLFIPINVKEGYHWIAAVVDFPQKLLTCYDSLLKQASAILRLPISVLLSLSAMSVLEFQPIAAVGTAGTAR